MSLADRERLLSDLLARYPDAYVAALRPDGIPVQLPTALPVARGHQRDERSAFFEMIVPEDIWAALAAWDSARATGSGKARVRLTSDPDRHVEVHTVDLTERHGVFIELAITEDGVSPWSERVQAPDARPRVATMRKDSHATLLSIDRATTQLLGWLPEDVVGRRTLDFTDPDHVAMAVTTYIDMLRTPGSARRSRLRYRRADGGWLWVEVTNHNLIDDPEYGCVLAEVVDVSEEMAYQEALRSREELLRRLTDALPVGVVHVDLVGRVLYRNEHLDTIVGGQSAATTVDELFASLTDSDRPLLSAALDSLRHETQDAALDVVFELPGGARHCTLSMRALTDRAGAPSGAVLCVSDMTESIRMRRELERRATTDSLTGCHTRASILTLLADSMRHATSGGTGVIFIDLDHFKEVNDRHGHAAGDDFLAEVARRLLGAVRQGDAVGRLGGDEFLVLCVGVGSARQLEDITERLTATLAAPVVVGRSVVPIEASFGMAWAEPDAGAPDDLVARADAAMYAAKRQRRRSA